MYPSYTLGRSTHHCHTTWSDGKNSVEEMVQQAIFLGFREIGISDHICIHPTLAPEKISWSMRQEKIGDYVQDVRRVATLFRDRIEVRIGAEVDFFAEFPSGTAISLKEYGFDYLIGSVHLLGENSFDSHATWWQNLTQEEIYRYHMLYLEKIKMLAQSGQFQFIGHIDLPKNFGFYSSHELKNSVEESFYETLMVIQKFNMAIEINTSGMKKTCHEFFPSSKIIDQCLQLGIPLIVNDDAHSIQELGQFFPLLRGEYR